jgi:hypothetical protein
MEQDFLSFLVARGQLPQSRVDAIREQVHITREPIGAIAFAHGLLTGEDIDVILTAQRDHYAPFGQIAAEQGLLTQAHVDTLVQIQHARAALSMAEALSLAGVMPMTQLLGLLSDYFTPAPAAKAA